MSVQKAWSPNVGKNVVRLYCSGVPEENKRARSMLDELSDICVEIWTVPQLLYECFEFPCVECPNEGRFYGFDDIRAYVNLEKSKKK